MKKALLALLLVIAASSSQAQSVWYDLQPNDTIYGEVPFDNLTIIDIYQFNNQPDTIILSWEKVYESYPSGWDFSLCDLGTCYPGLPLSGTMFPVAPGDSGFLGWNVIPNQVPGIGILRMYVYNAAHPNEGDTLTWIVNTPGFNGINELVENHTSIYPIPASQFVYVSSSQLINQIDLVNVTGQVLQSWNDVVSNERLNISEYNSGIYWLRLRLASGNVRTERLLIAR